MKTRLRARREILWASYNSDLISSFRKQKESDNFILDAVDSPRKLSLLSQKKISPDIAILDIDSTSKNISVFIFYLKKFQDMPIVVITHDSDTSLLDRVNKNLSVLLTLPYPTNKQSVNNLWTNVLDFFNEDLKKKLSKVEYLKTENVFACTFESKEMFFINRDHLPDDQKSDVESYEISKDGYFFSIKYDNGQTAEVPWDFIRYTTDQNFQYDTGKKRNKVSALTAGEVGQKIIDLRTSKEMTQEQLAVKSGILRNNISRIENGHHYPSLPLLEKIARALNVTVSNLLAK